MFRKFLIQLFVFIALAGLLWLGFSKINLKKATGIDQRIETLEEKLGDIFLNIFSQQYTEVKDDKVNDYLDEILDDLFNSNNIDPYSIDIYLMQSNTVNAFALPGHSIIILTGLVDFTETPEELTGVIAHEIAHVESGHVMKKLSREIGISVLFASVSGNYNMELLREVAQMIASNSYSRTIEREADQLAFEYLVNANINPRGLADIFQRFADEFDLLPEELQWISTHPASLERAKSLIKLTEQHYRDSYREYDSKEWNEFKDSLKDL
ncbi:MAG: M48 family metallopeptidase [Bacteroidales bacterium]